MANAQAHESLARMLESLGLVSRKQFASVAWRVRQLTRDLPDFESVWVDALFQAGHLTHYQAQQINAGRAAELVIGDYILREPLPGPAFAKTFLSTQRQSSAYFRLVITSSEFPPGQAANSIRHLLAVSKEIRTTAVPPPVDWGIAGNQTWIAAPFVVGRSAAEVMRVHGRYAPAVVDEMVRQVVPGLLEWEQRGLLHGDIGVRSLLHGDKHQFQLVDGGIRGIFRPAEGYALADLQPDAYSGLSPERVEGGPITIASEVFSFGCLIWNLLAGRPPIAGGTALVKLRNAHSCRIPDLKSLAPDASEYLLKLVESCLSRDPGSRPGSFEDLLAHLPVQFPRSAKRRSRQLPAYPFHVGAVLESRPRRARSWGLAAAAGAMLVMAVGTWPLLSRQINTHLSRAEKTEIEPTSSAASSAGSNRATADSSRSLVAGEDHSSSAGSPESHTRAPGAFADEGDAVPIGQSSEESTVPTGDVRLASNEEYADGKAVLKQPNRLAGRRERGTRSTTNKVRDRNSGRDDVVLEVGRPIYLPSLSVKAGDLVRGADNQRPIVYVPTTGLVIDQPNVVFDGIDFVWCPVPNGSSLDEQAAMLRISTTGVTFVGCSFQSVTMAKDQEPRLPVGVYRGSSRDESGALRVAAGSLKFTDCTFLGLSAAVYFAAEQRTFIDMQNCLHLGPGPLLVRDSAGLSALQAEGNHAAELGVKLSHFTVRGAKGIFELRAGPNHVPAITKITATDSIFVPASGEPLVRVSSENAVQLIESIQWTGQGSILDKEVPLVSVSEESGSRSTSAESSDDVLDGATFASRLSVQGLIQGGIRFAGSVEDGILGARLIQWQAPLQSEHPPGVDETILRLPRRVPRIKSLSEN